MGRPRTSDKHLPRRVYQRRGKFYYSKPDGKWIPLGDDYGTALRAYADIVGRQPINTLDQLFDRYLLEVIPSKAPRTQKDQTGHIELLKTAFGRLLPDQLTPRLVIRYRNARGQRSKTQANQELALLSHVCTIGIEWEVMESNPCRDVKKFKLAPRALYVEDADYRAMYAAAGSRLRILMDLALLTGQREGDLLKLKWDDIDERKEGGIFFRQGKTGKRLLVGWSPELRRVVASAKQIEPPGLYVVSTEDGQQYTTNGFQSLWRRARARAIAKDANPRLLNPFRFHDLRAKSASDDGLSAASERLGHADPRITERVYRRAPRKVSPLNIGQDSEYWTEFHVKPLKKSTKKR